jgi:hypothetical protein
MKSLLAGFGSLYGDGANREKPYNPHTVKQLDDFPRFPRQPPGSDAQRNDAMGRELRCIAIVFVITPQPRMAAALVRESEHQRDRSHQNKTDGPRRI